MGNDISSNGFLRVAAEYGPIHLSHNLIGNYNRDTEFVCQTLESTQEFGQVCLARTKLSSSGEISAVEIGEGVNND